MDYDNLADSLAVEALTEAADTFFGGRRRLEDRLEQFSRLVAEMRKKEEQVIHKGCFLNFLLRRGWAVDAFYHALGVEPADFHFFSRCEAVRSFERIPFAYTSRGRYIKFVHSAYRVFQQACDEFMNGRVYDCSDDPRRKRVTLHFTQVLKTAEALAEQVEKMNVDGSSVNALQYMKSLDPEMQRKEKVTEATLSGYAGSLDEGMAFHGPDLDALRAMALPELPTVDKATREITFFCKEVYAEHKDEINRILSDAEPPEGDN